MTKIEQAITIMFKDYPDCVTIKQLQTMLGIKKTKAYELIKNGEIKAKKIGKDYKISKLNIVAYVLGEEQLWAKDLSALLNLA